MSEILRKMVDEGRVSPEEYEAITGMRYTRHEVVGDQALVQQGEGNTAVQSGGVNVGRDVTGLVLTGDNHYLTAVINQANLPLDDDKLRQEIGKYLKWVIGNNQTITLQGIQDNTDAQRRYVTLALADVYVPLQAQATMEHDYLTQEDRLIGSRWAEEQRDISLSEVLTLGPRLAITGGPGCGKTTVLMHLAWALAAALGRNTPELAQQKLGLSPEAPLPLPIFLPINRYAEHLRQFQPAERRQRTLAAFISQYLIERQATLDLPEDFFH